MKKPNEYNTTGHLKNMEVRDWIVTKTGKVRQITHDEMDDLHFSEIERFATKNEVEKELNQSNNKEKWAFFFQYAGQEVIYPSYTNDYKPLVKRLHTAEDCYADVNVIDLDKSYASLWPIESLTDDEILTLAKIIYPFVDEWSDVDRDHIKNTVWIANKDDGCQSICITDGLFETKDTYGLAEEHMISLEAADYLRSISIAIPFRGDSVEEMISQGWVKLREG